MVHYSDSPYVEFAVHNATDGELIVTFDSLQLDLFYDGQDIVFLKAILAGNGQLVATEVWPSMMKTRCCLK